MGYYIWNYRSTIESSNTGMASGGFEEKSDATFMKRCILTALLLGITYPVQGQLSQDNFGLYVTLTSDYRFRGISQTLNDPAFQAGFDLQLPSGFFTGVWASNVDFFANRFRSGPRDVEIDLYAGYSTDFHDDWSAIFSAVLYTYPGSSVDYDYLEFAAGLNYRDLATLQVSYSNDALARGESAVNYELGIQYPLTNGFEIGGILGFYDTSRLFGTGYAYGNAGISKSWPRLVVDLRYHDTDDDAVALFRSYAGSRWVASLSVPIM